jgi:hypothetical protein
VALPELCRKSNFRRLEYVVHMARLTPLDRLSFRHAHFTRVMGSSRVPGPFRPISGFAESKTKRQVILDAEPPVMT